VTPSAHTNPAAGGIDVVEDETTVLTDADA
jgi:hypothetical protein